MNNHLQIIIDEHYLFNLFIYSYTEFGDHVEELHVLYLQHLQYILRTVS